MKKAIFTFAMLTVIMGTGFTQGMNLNFYSHYTFADRFDSYFDLGRYYEGRIEGGYQWGLGLEYMPNPVFGIEISYQRLDTKAPTNYLFDTVLPQFADFDLGLNYIMLGGTRYAMAPSGKVEGFGKFMGGAVIIDVNDPESGRGGTTTKFSLGVAAGGTLWPVERFGIRLQGQFMTVVQMMGGGFYFGTGGGGFGASTYSSIYQFSLGGGIVIKFGGYGY